MDFNILGSPESENHIFSSWCVCVSIISITQKQVVAGTQNLIFYIFNMRRGYLKHSMKIRQTVCVQVYSKEFKHIMAYGGNFL